MPQSLTLLRPTVFCAAFSGVLLFASSLIAGWVENWFVWHTTGGSKPNLPRDPTPMWRPAGVAPVHTHSASLR